MSTSKKSKKGLSGTDSGRKIEGWKADRIEGWSPSDARNVAGWSAIYRIALVEEFTRAFDFLRHLVGSSSCNTKEIDSMTLKELRSLIFEQNSICYQDLANISIFTPNGTILSKVAKLLIYHRFFQSGMSLSGYLSVGLGRGASWCRDEDSLRKALETDLMKSIKGEGIRDGEIWFGLKEILKAIEDTGCPEDLIDYLEGK